MCKDAQVSRRPPNSIDTPTLSKQAITPKISKYDGAMKFRRLCLLATSISINAPLTVLAGDSPDQVWSSVGFNTYHSSASVQTLPHRYQALRMDVPSMRSILEAAPMQEPRQLGDPLYLPMPDGSFRKFLVEYSPVMAPGLADRYPGITTYRAVAADDPATTGRLDFTPLGFHAMLTGPEGTVFIDPASRATNTDYVSYFKADARQPEEPWQCLVEDDGREASLPLIETIQGVGPTLPSGTQLRTYRTAVAATGEYTSFHGGTVPAGQAAIVTAINRVNQIYNRDLAIHLELISNNDSVVYTDGATDPFTNSSGLTMLGQNQANMDKVIGDANYDIGHVFSTGGGGVATLNSPCETGSKARGVTGLNSPTGDIFYIDFVSHEMGHQFDGLHTFNGSTGNCGGGNRSASAAYEPGSGSTIQAYAGICGAENLQSSSDINFHTHSFQEIINYTQSGEGNDCAAITATGNSVPVPDAGSAFTIPVSTPFMLTGSATDSDGDSLTYSWEQYDLGAAGPPNTDDGSRPIFRSFPPSTSPTRLFPKLSDIVNNTSTLGESLPTTTRSLTFRLTVRDNALGGGGVDFDTVVLSTTDGAGPFAITSQNSATEWIRASTQTINWDVANTNNAPVNCSQVDIDFSSDGGLNFATSLASAVSNDGSHSITVPDEATVDGRVRVKCNDNVFFDINDSPILIPLPGQQIGCSSPGVAIPDADLTGATDSIVLTGEGTIHDIDVFINVSQSYVGDLTFTLSRNESATSVILIDRPGIPNVEPNFGCPGDNIDVLLDDSSSIPVDDICNGSPPAISGTAAPQQALSAFNGEIRAGTWNLLVTDSASPDAGILNNWCISTLVGDTEGDGVFDDVDNCPGDSNPLQEDFDGDGVGYYCDSTCASSMDFVYDFGGSDLFYLQANNAIQYEGAISGSADITLDGGGGVVLKPGTSIQNGSILTILTMGCTP